MSRKSKRVPAQNRAPVPESRTSTGNGPLKLSAFLFAVAAGISAWLLYYAITQKPMAGCGPGSPCDRVMGSSWAYWLNVPVTAPALLAYVLLAGSALLLLSKREPSRPAWNLGTILSIAVLAAAIWFIHLQVNVIKSVCKYCTATHLLAIAGAVIFLIKAPRPAKPARLIVLTIVGLIMVGGIIAGQKIAPHKTNVLSIYSGKFQFNLREVPLVGSPANDKFVISLFDYTCPDCQEMHGLLKAARERKGNSFSIVALPVPLDANCNHTIKVTREKHKDACALARIGLGVRRCGKDLFEQYDDWFFTNPQSIPTLQAAREKAESLAGKEKLQKAMTDPWIEETIRRDIEIFEHNGATTKSYRMPQLIAGSLVNIGPITKLDELLKLLDKGLYSPTATTP